MRATNLLLAVCLVATATLIGAEDAVADDAGTTTTSSTQTTSPSSGSSSAASTNTNLTWDPPGTPCRPNCA